MLARIARIAALAFALIALAGSPARADFADSLFDKLNKLPTGINPDHIEMARYTIRYPANADMVFARAAAQDYPFFALVGAVKLAKDRSFPQLGVFSEAKCMSPITAIDVVFAKASGTIDDPKGKADTSSAIGVAQTYAARYAKAQSDGARQQLINELNQSVPYFKDIGLICHFAFQTSFSTERNLKAFADQVAQELRAAHRDFKKGKVSEGVQHLIAAGASQGLICALIDDAVAGGAIGNTPVIGDLAKGVCKSFAGKMIKGLQSAAKAMVCLVEALWGGCDADTPPPPTGYSEAHKFCGPYGGLKAMISRTNRPDDYSVICNDGSRCILEPGKKPRCATAAQIAKHKAELTTKAAVEYESGKLVWAKDFDSTWTSGCPDAQCKGAMAVVRTGTLLEAKRQHEADPTEQWPLIAGRISASAEVEAEKVMAEANARTTAKAADAWQVILVVKWSKDCADALCVADIKALVQKTHDETLALQNARPDQSSLSIQGEVFRKYGPQYQSAVDASKKRVAVLADPSSPPPARLRALGCKALLGRADQYLCEDAKAWQLCVTYVKERQAQVCTSPQLGPYADRARTISILAGQGCAHQGNADLVFKCARERPGGLELCNKLKANGVPVVCN